MLPEADDLLKLMKHKIDKLLANDPNLQKFLHWLNKKSKSVNVSYKDSAVRAFYLDLDLSLDYEVSIERAITILINPGSDNKQFYHNLDDKINFDGNRDLNRDHVLYGCLNRALSYVNLSGNYLDDKLDSNRKFSIRLGLNLDLGLDLDLDPKLKIKLENLKAQIPDSRNFEILKQWWKEQGNNWAAKLRSMMIEHLNISHDWRFTEREMRQLRQYYNANKFLLNCLNSDCYVTKATRQEIEDTLLLPISEIEKRKIQ